MKRQKVMISERALLQRLNRALAERELRIKSCKETSRAFSQLGRFYVVDNDGLAMNVDLAAWGRKYGALKPWEELDGSAE